MLDGMLACRQRVHEWRLAYRIDEEMIDKDSITNELECAADSLRYY